jgi:hypothetical protein
VRPPHQLAERLVAARQVITDAEPLAGNADGAASLHRRDLADGAADSAGCRRDDYHLACSRAA